jgi:hypothetical protein
MMKRSFAIILLLIFFAATGWSQKRLILERPGTTKYYIFKVGDEITLMNNRDKRKIHGGISRIGDTSIIVNYLETADLNGIIAVYRPLKMMNLFSRVATDAGLGYFLLTGFNNSINNELPLIDHGTLVASTIVTGVGLVTRFLRYRKYNIGHAWRIKIIDLDLPKQ